MSIFPIKTFNLENLLKEMKAAENGSVFILGDENGELISCQIKRTKLDQCEKHDWAYDRGFFARKRECLKCGRKEHREIIDGYGYDFSEWYVKI